MTQKERLAFLIEYLIKESDELKSLDIPAEDTARKRLLRSLMNVRPPKPAAKDFLKIQDEYLQEEYAHSVRVGSSLPCLRRTYVNESSGGRYHCRR